MKLNNHGWGMREMIIYSCIMILLLIFVASSISSLYSNIEKTNVKNRQEYQQRVEKAEQERLENEREELKQELEKPINKVDTTYYKNIENKIKTATMNYMNTYNYALNGQILKVTVDTLVGLNFIDEIKDQNGNSTCSGYSNVYEDENGSYVIKSYVTCSNYSSEGY